MPIFLITGPPGAGKSTLAEVLAIKFTPTIVIPVDEIREWVKSGISHPTDWTDETERQFQIAELAALKVATTYNENNFTAVIDHCRNLTRLNNLTQDIQVTKILLLPSLEIALKQNAIRTNKQFDPAILEPIIRFTHQTFESENKSGWIVLRSNSESESWLKSFS